MQGSNLLLKPKKVRLQKGVVCEGELLKGNYQFGRLPIWILWANEDFSHSAMLYIYVCVCVVPLKI